jgi:predicted AAA+ superfamily ATPase
MFDKHLINSINIDGKDIVINREEYINEILEYKDKNLIKVLSGMRRCGKSEIMKHYILKLKTLGIKDENILFIQLQNKSTYEFRDYLSMTKYILGLLNNNNEKYYIFLDEIQEIEEFEKSIVELFEHNNFDLYISGSNSKLLSSNLSTLLTGRKIIINIYPLSFNECFRFLNLNFNKSEDEV